MLLVYMFALIGFACAVGGVWIWYKELVRLSRKVDWLDDNMSIMCKFRNDIFRLTMRITELEAKLKKARKK